MTSKATKYIKTESSNGKRTAVVNSKTNDCIQKSSKAAALAEKESRAEKRKALTIRAFNAAYESHHKKR